MTVGPIGRPELVAGAMMLALNGYALTGGADFGGGVWDLLAAGPRRDEQRRLIADSIGPIWEANHVWLIVVVVVLFTGFPPAFGVLGIVLHVPITILLVGIVLRGSAFVFRGYGRADRALADRWGLVFSVASVVTPICLGIVVGALSSDAVAAAAGRVGSASFREIYVDPWLAVYPVVVGLFALALFAMLAAVYSAFAAKSDELREDFRARALVAAVVVGVAAAAALLQSTSSAPRIAAGVTHSPWSLVLHACTGLAAVTTIAALWRRRYRLARVAAASQVSLVLWGWALAQYPFVIPPSMTIRQAAAPPLTLDLLLAGLVVGALVLIPSLRMLFKTFMPRHEEAPATSDAPTR
jgi:cytochrome bd ubiquinol oxidase subunit II